MSPRMRNGTRRTTHVHRPSGPGDGYRTGDRYDATSEGWGNSRERDADRYNFPPPRRTEQSWGLFLSLATKTPRPLLVRPRMRTTLPIPLPGPVSRVQTTRRDRYAEAAKMRRIRSKTWVPGQQDGSRRFPLCPHVWPQKYGGRGIRSTCSIRISPSPQLQVHPVPTNQPPESKLQRC
jgi:hypothetical protein